MSMRARLMAKMLTARLVWWRFPNGSDGVIKFCALKTVNFSFSVSQRGKPALLDALYRKGTEHEISDGSD